MNTTILPHYRIRERQRTLGISTASIEAIADGERYPFIQAVQHEDRWLIMCGPELATVADCGVRFPPTFTVWSHDDAQRWVELLAGLYGEGGGGVTDFYANLCQRAQGEPEVHCIGERVHLYPTGVGGIHLSMTVDKVERDRQSR